MAGKRETKIITEYPEHREEPTPEIGEAGAGAQAGSELSPEEEKLSRFAAAFGGFQPKVKVFRILDGGTMRHVGDLTAAEIDENNNEESIRNLAGGGKFQLRFCDPEGNVVHTVGPIEIEGPPKTPPATPGFNINLPVSGGTAGAAPDITGALVQMFALIQQSNRDNQQMMVEMVKATNKPQANPQALQLKETIEIVKLLNEEKKGGFNWEKAFEIGSMVLDKVAMLFPGAVPDSPGMFIAQQLLPSAKDILHNIGEKIKQPTIPPQARPAVEVHPNLTPGVAPEAAPVAAAPAEPQLDPRIAFMRQKFEEAYKDRLLHWAAEDMNAWAMAKSLEPLVGDTRNLLPMMGFSKPEEFYAKYQDFLAYRDWFDEFFFYLMDPSAPEIEEPEEEDKPTVEVEPEPTNGRASRRKKAPVEVQ